MQRLHTPEFYVLCTSCLTLQCNSNVNYWGEADHIICSCLVKQGLLSTQKAAEVVEMPCPHTVRPHSLVSSSSFVIQVHLWCSENVYILTTLMDSRSVGNLINQDNFDQLQLPVRPLEPLLCAWAIDGGPISQEVVTHCTSQSAFK